MLSLVLALVSNFSLGWGEGVLASGLVLDIETEEIQSWGGVRVNQRYSPCSTFKIVNTVIGLDEGVVGPDEIFRWDGLERPIRNWNQDLTLEKALQYSAVWVYEEIALRVPRETYRSHLRRLHYGNADVSGDRDAFWLVSSLEISTKEQIWVLKKLLGEDHGFDQKAVDLTRGWMTREKSDKGELIYKTGSGRYGGGRNIAWVVGWIEGREGTKVVAFNAFGPGVSGFETVPKLVSFLKDQGLL